MCDSLKIHQAYKEGDLEVLKALLGDPPDFPNCRGPAGVGEIILEYAIYHGPLPFIRRLLELGADPNYGDHAGFPSLIATLSCQERPDRHAILELQADQYAGNQLGIADMGRVSATIARTGDMPVQTASCRRGVQTSTKYGSFLEDAPPRGHERADSETFWADGTHTIAAPRI